MSSSTPTGDRWQEAAASRHARQLVDSKRPGRRRQPLDDSRVLVTKQVSWISSPDRRVVRRPPIDSRGASLGYLDDRLSESFGDANVSRYVTTSVPAIDGSSCNENG